jgi:hypothetical protein
VSGNRRPLGPILIAAALLVAAVVALVTSRGRSQEPDAPPESAASPVVTDAMYGAYSTSALGTLALYEILKERRPPVERRLADSPQQQGPFSALVISDTMAAHWFGEGSAIDSLQDSKGRALAILPKWLAETYPTKRAWVRNARPFQQALPTSILSDLAEAAGIPDTEGMETFTLDGAPAFTYNETGIEPDFGGSPVQLMRLKGMRPIVSSTQGVLVGELTSPGLPRVWVVSDPDITSNHGIVRGRNLRFAMRLFELWTLELPRTATITFDESHLQRRSGTSAGQPFRLLTLTGPEKGPILLAFLAALLLMLFGMKRLWPEQRAPEVPFGKAGLIANTARLLERGPIRAELFRKYVDATVGAAARRLKAPPAARRNRAALTAWLDSRAPGREPWRLAKIAAEAERELSLPSPSTARLLFFAGRLHLWKEEAEIGPGTGGKDHGRRPRRGR